jgi:hypothetical protein
MIAEAVVQYIGFQATSLVREYTFQVREAGAQREFKLSIENAAFTSQRAKFQDGPGICSLRLRTELASATGGAAAEHYLITGAELDKFREAHSPKSSRGGYTPKRDDDF